MIKKINKTKITISINDITKEPLDILVNWTVNTLAQGDLTWKAIHREGGSVLHSECLSSLTQYGVQLPNRETVMPAGRVVLTKGGLLDVYYIIHTVLPNKRIKEELENKDMYFLNCLQNILLLTDSISKTEVPIYSLGFYPLPESVFGEVNESHVITFWKHLIDFNAVKNVKLICKTKEEYNFYSSVLEKLTTPYWERVLNKIFKNKF